MQGLQIEIAGGFAFIEFLDPSKRGETLAALNAVAGPGFVTVDTSGTRKTYIVPESIAQQAGILPADKDDAEDKKVPARKRAAAKAKAE